jgi:hypothetical protein
MTVLSLASTLAGWNCKLYYKGILSKEGYEKAFAKKK